MAAMVIMANATSKAISSVRVAAARCREGSVQVLHPVVLEVVGSITVDVLYHSTTQVRIQCLRNPTCHPLPCCGPASGSCCRACFIWKPCSRSRKASLAIFFIFMNRSLL